MKKTTWYISAFLFLAGFFVISPLLKIIHHPFANTAYIIAGAAGIIFILISLPWLYKKMQ